MTQVPLGVEELEPPLPARLLRKALVHSSGEASSVKCQVLRWLRIPMATLGVERLTSEGVPEIALNHTIARQIRHMADRLLVVGPFLRCVRGDV